MAIRYDESLLQEIRRTVKNYQAKRQRVLAKGGEIIPDPAYVANFLNDYTDRRELLRDLKKLQRYSVKGSEEIVEFDTGLRLTNYQITEAKRLAATAKRNITIALKSVPQDRRLQPLEEGQVANLQLRYEYLSKPIGKLSLRQWKTYERIAYGEGDLSKKRRTFYDNVQTMIEQITFGLPDNIANAFKTAISKLSMEKLVDLVQKDSYLNSIIDFYEVLKAGGKFSNFNEQIVEITDYINAL